MLLKSLSFILFFSFIPICFPAYGQQDIFPIDQGISALCSRKDNQSIHFRTIAHEIYDLDSAKVCELIQIMRDEGPDDNVHYQIRLDLLQCFMRLFFGYCPEKEL